MTIVLLACAAIGTTGARADLPQPVTTTAPVRANEPVVLTGSLFPDWSAGPELTFRASQVPVDYGVADSQGLQPAYLRSDCYVANPPPDVNGYVDTNHDDHNCYQSNQLPFRTAPGRTGVDPNALLGYRWDGKRNRFVQIPFQVDTKWIHYISNNASGFAFYSGVDQELTYTFDREGFRFTTNAPFNPSNPAVVCQSAPVGGIAAAPDPNPWLIDTDEMAFMARDAGAQAPPGATLPRGIADAREVVITDPITLEQSFAYVMLSAKNADGTYRVTYGEFAAVDLGVTREVPSAFFADGITEAKVCSSVIGSVITTSRASAMPRGSVAPGGAWAPASRAMNAISSVSISHGLGSGAAAMPPTGADWHTTAGLLGLNGALVVKRKPSRSNV